MPTSLIPPKRRFMRFYVCHTFFRLISYALSSASIPLVWWRITYSNPEFGYADGSPYLSHLCAPNVPGGPVICQDTVFHDTPNLVLRDAQTLGFVSLLMVVLSYWIVRIIRRFLLIRHLRRHRHTMDTYVQEQEFLLATSDETITPSESVDALIRQSTYRLTLLKYFFTLDTLALFFQLLGFVGFTVRTKAWYTDVILPLVEQSGGAYTVTYESFGKTAGSIMCFTAVLISLLLLIVTTLSLFREKRIFRSLQHQHDSIDQERNPPSDATTRESTSSIVIPSAPSFLIVNTTNSNDNGLFVPTKDGTTTSTNNTKIYMSNHDDPR